MDRQSLIDIGNKQKKLETNLLCKKKKVGWLEDQMELDVEQEGYYQRCMNTCVVLQKKNNYGMNTIEKQQSNLRTSLPTFLYTEFHVYHLFITRILICVPSGNTAMWFLWSPKQQYAPINGSHHGTWWTRAYFKPVPFDTA